MPDDALAHAFFVCPFPWTDSITSAVAKRRSDIAYQMGRYGVRTEFHFLSLYPVPNALAGTGS